MRNGPHELVVAPKAFPGKKYRGKYCYKHSLVWWQKSGELAKEGEVIHHVNGNKRDNRFCNLEKHTKSGHGKLHHPIKTQHNATCSHCERGFRVTPYKLMRPYIFCSRKCIGLFRFPNKARSSANLDLINAS